MSKGILVVQRSVHYDRNTDSFGNHVAVLQRNGSFTKGKMLRTVKKLTEKVELTAVPYLLRIFDTDQTIIFQ